VTVDQGSADLRAAVAIVDPHSFKIAWLGLSRLASAGFDSLSIISAEHLGSVECEGQFRPFAFPLASEV